MFKEGGENAKKLREQLLARMGDVSEFMKTLKQRFTIWFNRNHKRFGPLWAERFKSTIIEGTRNHHFALQMVAAYIDLNPVRAGMFKDPKDYRWSGYGEAASGNKKSLAGLRLAVSGASNLSDKQVLATYRVGLFAKGAAPKHGDPKSARIRAGELQKVLDATGALTTTASQFVQQRVVPFTGGGVIGGEAFVQEHLDDYRATRNKRHGMEPTPLTPDNIEDNSRLFSMRGKK
jgi:hypothetical protein